MQQVNSQAPTPNNGHSCYSSTCCNEFFFFQTFYLLFVELRIWPYITVMDFMRYILVVWNFFTKSLETYAIANQGTTTVGDALQCIL